MPKLVNILDLDFRGRTTLLGAAWTYARAAVGAFGGTASMYMRGGAISQTNVEGIRALEYVDLLKTAVADMKGEYNWVDSGEDNWEYHAGYYTADMKYVELDADAILAAIDAKMAEGEDKVMALRIKIAIEKSGGAKKMQDRIERAIYAAYEDEYRKGVDRTIEQRQEILDIISVIRNA